MRAKKARISQTEDHKIPQLETSGVFWFTTRTLRSTRQGKEKDLHEEYIRRYKIFTNYGYDTSHLYVYLNQDSLLLAKGMATHSSIFAGEFHGQRGLAGYSPRVAKSQTWLSDQCFHFHFSLLWYMAVSHLKWGIDLASLGEVFTIWEKKVEQMSLNRFELCS